MQPDQTLASVLEDLSGDIDSTTRYQRLLDYLFTLFPCDAAALMQLQQEYLVPVAVQGLHHETLGRHFHLSQHPRLERILHSHEPVQFPADSSLPDPFDGLINGLSEDLHVHDCVGASIHVDGQVWGVLSLDALEPGSFQKMTPADFRAAVAITRATVRVASLINQLEQNVILERQRASQLESSKYKPMIGRSPAMLHLQDELIRVADSDLTVLVLGETGVGKELVASEIHRRSTRREQPMVEVNCAALPEQMAESELFGHTRGSFTGAISERKGKFQLADKGTLFLDEVGELPLQLQAKLLRVLQSGEIQRPGSDRQIKVDVRIIAATNRDLADEVRAGRFRADLYHRLSVYPLVVPPLRERGHDIQLLCGHFLEICRSRFGLRGVRLSPEVESLLARHTWPGNVRELEHTIHRAIIRARDQNCQDILTLEPVHLDIDSLPAGLENGDQGAYSLSPELLKNSETLSLKQATDEFQRKFILDAVHQARGRWSHAAKALNMHTSNLYRLARRLAIDTDG
ncbi:nitric oxide reductase transcriptional regulator NorR [Endozoicomonadaceae bacterium StTr2]